MLHVVNGDELMRKIVGTKILRPLDPALREHRDPDAAVPWRDVLYEGPVREGLSPVNLADERARYIASQGWDAYITARQAFGERDAIYARTRRQDEVVYWFEDDLYDVLQLVQALDRLAARRPEDTRFTWVLLDSRQPLSDDAVAATLAIRQPVPREAWAQARLFWRAFISPDPASLRDLVAGDSITLPVLRGGLERLVEEFPAIGSGLSRSERLILEAAATGAATPGALFARVQTAETRPFLGDSQFFGRLHRFATAPEPLIVREDGGGWVSPVEDLLSPDVPDMDAFHAQSLVLTDTGRAVLAGQRDWLAAGGSGRWLGGYQITGPASWRWDQGVGRLVGPAGH